MKRRLEELNDLALLTREEAIEFIMLEWPCGRKTAEAFLDVFLKEDKVTIYEARYSGSIH